VEGWKLSGSEAIPLKAEVFDPAVRNWLYLLDQEMVDTVTELQVVRVKDLLDDWVASAMQWKGKRYLSLDVDYVGWIRHHFGGDISQDELERILVALLVKESYVARDYHVYNKPPIQEITSEELAGFATTYEKAAQALEQFAQLEPDSGKRERLQWFANKMRGFNERIASG
jgi:hypothetical protein